jgi:hypothetical protein
MTLIYLLFLFLFQTIVCKKNKPFGSGLASENQCFNLDLLDQNLTLEKQYQWKNGFIQNICCSSMLKNFIFTTKNKQIYLFNDNITSIECIRTIEEQDWYSCACLFGCVVILNKQ